MISEKPTAFKIEGPDIYDIPLLFEADVVGLWELLGRAIERWGLKGDPHAPKWFIAGYFGERPKKREERHAQGQGFGNPSNQSG